MALLATLAVAPMAQAKEAEELHFRWKLKGFVGAVARLFLPGEGHGRLSTTPTEGGRQMTELLITSPRSAAGEYFRYAAELDGSRTLRAWSSYKFRGKTKEKDAELTQENVIDITSGILLVRKVQPTDQLDLTIWNDGKVYPVAVHPMGRRYRDVLGVRKPVRFYAIRPRIVEGEPVWKGSLDLYLDDDERATPVEIVVDRSLARVRLVLADSPQ